MFERLTSLPALKSIPFSFVMILMQAFLLVNASLIIEEGAVAGFRSLIMTYMLLIVSLRIFAGGLKFSKGGIPQGIMWFGIGLFGGTVVLTGGMPQIFQHFQLAPNAPLALLLTQVFVVAASETMIFQDYLVQIISPIPAQIVFALFHAAAYGLALGNILLAFVAGMIFYLISRYTSLWMSAGCHASYNLVILLGIGVL